jgi:diguanylate cyclase (GGDEF)-like protein/PAS domain S-box-containing protein
MARILIIDDRPVNRAFLNTLLRQVNHEIIEAPDGPAALALVRERRPDLIITDLMLPPTGGVEFAMRVRDDAAIAGTPIIFYTATYRTDEALDLARRCGAMAVLIKPFDPQEVLGAVATAIEARGNAPPSPSLPPQEPVPEAPGTGLPDYVQGITGLQRGMRQQLRDAVAAIAGQASNPSAADIGVDAILPIAERLSSMLELDIALANENETGAMIALFCRSARGLLRCRRVALAMLDETGHGLRHLEMCGFDKGAATQVTAAALASRALGAMLESGKPLRVADAEAARQIGLPEAPLGGDVLLLAPIPMRASTRAIGWIICSGPLDRPAFDAEDERFLVAITAQFAIAHGNLMRLKDASRHAEALEAEVARHHTTLTALRESEDRFRQIAANVDAVFLLVTADCSWVHYVNPAYERVWGRPCASLYAHARSWLEAIRADEREAVVDTIVGRSTAGLGFEVETRIQHPDGSERWIRMSGSPISAEASAEPRTAVVANDVTATKLAIAASHESERRLKEMLDNAELIALMLDHRGRIIYCNECFARLTGWTAMELSGQDYFKLFVAEADRQQRRQRFEERLAETSTNRHHEGEIVIRSGERRMLRWSHTLLRDGGVPIGTASLAEDVTEQRAAQARAAFLTSHNAASGLPRIGIITDYLEAACIQALQQDSRVIVLYINLDRFHALNEMRGRTAGDRVLATVGRRLVDVVGEMGIVGHVASDEFVLVLKDPTRIQDQAELGESVRARVEEPIDTDLYISCSIGVSCLPDNAASADELLRQAESAMRRAKSEGRNTVFAFASEHQQELKDRLALGVRLKQAVRAGEFTLHYQPRINGHDWRVAGFEALLRWHHPEFGLLLPARFLGVAEDLGLMVEIGSFVLQNASAQARAWLDSGARDFSISVNVSPLQMQRPGFVDEVRDVLARFKLPAQCLELELTETMMMGNVERVIGTMRALKAIGVRLSLDDFGTGFSSLNYLRRFPLDTLKIDQSFVRDISTDPGAAGVCRAIITLGHQLNMTVLAEGVEIDAQIGYLRRNECDYFQGYYFGKPVAPDRALELLQHRYLAHERTDPEVDEKPTLLLVDDEENILNALIRMLRRDGYRILTATNADDALDILGRNDVQVVLSDQRMPGISGTELLSRVKDMYPNTVRIVLSGYTDLAAVTAAINQGAIYKFLTKPWDDEDLRLQIRDAFRIARRGDKARRSGVPE